jgi:hypothetical protein
MVASDGNFLILNCSAAMDCCKTMNLYLASVHSSLTTPSHKDKLDKLNYKDVDACVHVKFPNCDGDD